MSVFGVLRRAGLLPPLRVATLADFKPGRVVMEGTLGSTNTISSPIQAVKCVGYHYRASERAPYYGGGYTRLWLMKAQVYATGLFLRLNPDETVRIRPKEVQEFGAEHHAKLAAQEYEDFKARERRLVRRTPVIVHGDASKEGELWIVRFDSLEIVEKPDAAQADPRQGHGR